MKQLDEDGQPPRHLYASRVEDRLVAELIGTCKGAIMDGVVSEGEALGLRRWISGHPDVVRGYPGSMIADRLERILADGVVDAEEQRELSELLLDLTGETPDHNEPLNRTAAQFYDNPLPTVLFDAQEYVFTGRMCYKTRGECEQAVLDRGGRVLPYVRVRTNFVVVGPIGSAAWLHSTHGTKLLKAAELRESGAPIHIIPEDHWIQALETGA